MRGKLVGAGERDAMNILKRLPEVEVVHFVQARINDRIKIADTRRCLAVAAQAARDHLVKRPFPVPQIIPQPSRLLVTQIGEAVIAFLVGCPRVRLPVPDQ
jgi:hypothetical protein